MRGNTVNGLSFRIWSWALSLALAGILTAGEAAAWPSVNVLMAPVLLAQQDLSEPNPNRPRAKDVEDTPFWVNFEESPLKEVVAALGAKTGKNFFIDPSVGVQTVTVIAHHEVPGDLAFEILEAILDAYNLAMFPTLDGNLYRIANRGTGTDKLKITVDDEDPIEGFDRVAIHIVSVKHSDAAEVSELMQSVGSSNAQIRVYARTNMLVLIDTVNGIRNMLEILTLVDVPGFEITYEIFWLHHSRAETISQQLLEVLQDDGTGGTRPRPTQPATAQRIRATRAAAGGRQETTIVGAGEQVLRIVADERLNALIVVASLPMMEQVRFFIKQLDVPTPFESNNMHYVELLYADAEDVQEALDALVSASAPRQAGAQQQEDIQPFERNVFITVYEQNNALLVVASPQDFEVLMGLISHLDRPRKQVNVQAIILAVTITDQFEWAVEGTAGSQSDFFALSNIANIANAIANPLSLAGAGTTFGILNETTTLSVVDPETGVAAETTVANIPFLIRAIEGLTDAEVLSQPNLLMQDNTEARMVVGQEVPVLNSLSDVDDRSGFQSRGSISRENVGVQLTVTPQINEGGMVRMELAIEVSDTIDSAVGVDPNELGPTFQKSEFNTEVVIKDGQTGIIGGLIRENKSRVRTQTPLLGDLPLLGWLFRTKRSSRNKQNLVIMVTPRIVRELNDLDAITDYHLEQFYRHNQDVILEDLGFVKKQRKKNWKRDRYSPVNEYNKNADPRTLHFKGETSD